MPAKSLTNGPTLTDSQVDAAGLTLAPVPDNVMVLLRHLQAQVTALTARVEDLEAP